MTDDYTNLEQFTTDPTQIAGIEKENLGPAGTYQTIPEWKRYEVTGSESIRRFRGAAKVTKRDDGQEPDTRLWQLDFRVDFNGTPENPKAAASKNYVALAKAFKVAYGRDSKHAGELADYVTRYPLTLRARRLDGRGEYGPSLFVVDIKAADQS